MNPNKFGKFNSAPPQQMDGPPDIVPTVEISARQIYKRRIAQVLASLVGVVGVTTMPAMDSVLPEEAGVERAVGADSRRSSSEKAKNQRVRVPRLPSNASIKRGVVSANRAHLRRVGVDRTRCKGVKRAECDIAIGYSRRVIKKAKTKDGDVKRIVRFKRFSPGARISRRAPVYLSLKPNAKAVRARRERIRYKLRTDKSVVPDQPPVTEIVAPPIIQPPVPEPKTETPPEQPEKLTEQQLLEKSQERIDNDTVFVPFMENCTGIIARDHDGNPIGVITAKHCGAGDAEKSYDPETGAYSMKLSSDSNGNFAVYGGENHDQPVIEVDRAMLLPGNLETVLFVAKGADPEAVRQAWEMQVATPDQLKLGQLVAGSGYPVTETGNSKQAFNGLYLGERQVESAIIGSGGFYINARIVGTPLGVRACIPGDSGGSAVMTTGEADGLKQSYVGVLSGYAKAGTASFDDIANSLAMSEDQKGSYTSLCLYTYDSGNFLVRRVI